MKTQLSLSFALLALAAWQPAVQAQNLNPAASSTVLPDQQRPEGFIMVGNRVHVVSRGVATPLEEDMMLRITPTGIVGFDQMPRAITNNAMLTLDGRIVAAPAVSVVSVVPSQTVAASTTAPDPRSSTPGYVVYGTNLSGLAPARTTVTSQSGPRFISAKKSTVSKGRTSTTKAATRSVAAKRPAAKAAPAPVLPAFNDEVLRLPDLEQPAAGALEPKIDATSTMLYMTAAPDPSWTPESESIGASLGINTTSNAEASLPPVSAPVTQPGSLMLPPLNATPSAITPIPAMPPTPATQDLKQ